jgi:hypothetical protein
MPDLDLMSLFGKATQALQENKDALNKADGWNGNHGDNMVEIFNLATEAIRNNPDASPAEQLAQAGKALAGAKSGSAQLYSNGFAQAAEAVKGKDVTPQNMVAMVQSLMGAGAQSQEEENPIAGLFGGLLGSDPDNQDDKFDLSDVIDAGFSFVKSKNRGEDTLTSLVGAIMGQSPASGSAHRSKSGELVTSSLLKSLLDN